ncbi:MAG: hypothetical protein QOH51_563 [Acidobacteriota bacterium]|nr:hypothetical protein [Acidobacteriota bacterium]
MLSGRRKLLLADDSPTIQKVISLTFGDEGMEVVAVGDGTQALRVLEESRPPDILLADVSMPGPDGYELCERVKRDERLRHIPVVLLVGMFEPFNEAEARRVGADIVLTKPFQSIRDLVSKVGSLLGGESKLEREPAREEERLRPVEPAEEAQEESLRTDSHAQTEQAAPPVASAYEEHFDAPHADAASSFADLGADDELIEAKSADAFGAPAVHAVRSERVQTFSEAHESSQLSASQFEASGSAAPAAPQSFGASSRMEEALTNQTEETLTNHTDEMLTKQTEDREMPEQPSLDTRATSAAAADDSLLDLGQFGSHAATDAAEADDFVLDLDFEDELALPSAHAGYGAVATEASGTEVSSGVNAPVWADAPSAFAEAAHGDQPRHFAESAAPFDQQTPSYAEPSYAEYSYTEPSYAEHAPSSDEPVSSFDESASSFDESAASFVQTEFSEAPSGTAHVQDTDVAEVFMQDGPQGFASYTEPQEVGTASRGFVEPEVVPADEPSPAVVEGEFTDGSVEGDVPKAPSGYDTMPFAVATNQPAPKMAATEMTETDVAAAHDTAPSEPSAVAGYAVGEARVGLEEPLRADQLSPEAIDAIARRVVELMSDHVVREIAWDVVPELAEALIKQRLDEEKRS